MLSIIMYKDDSILCPQLLLLDLPFII